MDVKKNKMKIDKIKNRFIWQPDEIEFIVPKKKEKSKSNDE